MSTLQKLFNDDQVFAHPTEGVWGLGCNPFSEVAVNNLFSLKKRPRNKGIIILTGNEDHLTLFLKHLTKDQKKAFFQKSPGPHTWLIPSNEEIPTWLQGDSGLVAVRLSLHPDVIRITNELKNPICSSSANLSGGKPAMNKLDIKKIFGRDLHIIDGELGKLNKPTPVQELTTGTWIRK